MKPKQKEIGILGFGGMVVHSPIRGVHPDLFLVIKTFVKYIGADSNVPPGGQSVTLKAWDYAQKSFSPPKPRNWANSWIPRTTASVLRFTGRLPRCAAQYNLKFSMPHVPRPVLTAPNPAIGGHCIVPNAKILKHSFHSKALDLILAYRPKEPK